LDFLWAIDVVELTSYLVKVGLVHQGYQLYIESNS